MADPFLAEIVMFGGNFAPRGWAFCDGQLLPISQYSALFSLLGTIYGGDGRTTFALPDLRGRAAIHPGNGPGLSPYKLGQKGGTENVTLTVNQIPSHSHALNVNSGTGDQASPAGNFLAASPTAGLPPAPQFPLYKGGSHNATMNTNAVGNTGGSQSHTNIEPYLCVNFIIALQGIYPSRN